MSRKSEIPEKQKNYEKPAKTEKSEKSEKTEKPEKLKSSSGQMRDKLRFRDYWHEKGKFYGGILKFKDKLVIKCLSDA